MKVIIISDIQGKTKSIIPYGLRMARANEVPVDILHTIDPRKTQGTSSPYADSQSITPGTKMSHEKIIQREMHVTRQALEKYISGEGSRLNYPLKIKLLVEANSPVNSISTIIDRDPESLIIANYQADNSMVDDLDELLSLALNLKIPTLFIPPEYPFKEAQNCMLYTDFNHRSYETLSMVMRWLTSFGPIVHAFGMSDKNDKASALKNGSTWKREALNYLELPINIKTTIINYGDPYQQFADYIQRNNTDLILLPRHMIKKGGKFRLSPRLFAKAMNEVSLPAAIY